MSDGSTVKGITLYNCTAAGAGNKAGLRLLLGQCIDNMRRSGS